MVQLVLTPPAAHNRHFILFPSFLLKKVIVFNLIILNDDVIFQVKQPISSFLFERLSSFCSLLLRQASQSVLPHLPWIASLLGRVQVQPEL